VILTSEPVGVRLQNRDRPVSLPVDIIIQESNKAFGCYSGTSRSLTGIEIPIVSVLPEYASGVSISVLPADSSKEYLLGTSVHAEFRPVVFQ
jgi:hypothetical protein